MSKSNVYRDGKIYVMSRRCDSCIFHPGNRMQLQPGRVRGMVDKASKNEGCIPCHETIFGQAGGKEAVCRGFFDLHPTAPLQIAERLGFIEWQDAVLPDIEPDTNVVVPKEA